MLSATPASCGCSSTVHCGRRDSLRARRGSVWADRPRGWAGPGPHLDPTSAPSHILAAQVTGGSGRREQRARRGRGAWSAHQRDGAVARPRLGRGVAGGIRDHHWLLSTLISPIRASRGPYWPRDLRAPVGVPLNRQEEGRKSEPSAGHGDARRSRVAGHGVAAQGWGACLPQREPRRAFPCQSFLCAGSRGWREDGKAAEGTLWSLRPLGARGRWRAGLAGTQAAGLAYGRDTAPPHPTAAFSGGWACVAASGHLHTLPLSSSSPPRNPGGIQVTTRPRAAALPLSLC